MQPAPAGLGDRLASGLEAVGITKERVSRLIGKPCGCKTRQERLNRIGRYIADKIGKLGIKLPPR